MLSTTGRKKKAIKHFEARPDRVDRKIYNMF